MPRDVPSILESEHGETEGLGAGARGALEALAPHARERTEAGP